MNEGVCPKNYVKVCKTYVNDCKTCILYKKHKGKKRIMKKEVKNGRKEKC